MKLLAVTLALGLPLLALTSPVESLSGFFKRQAAAVQRPIHASLPNVTLLATGGTIASRGSSNTQTTDYSLGLGVEDLMAAVPEIFNISNVFGYQVSNTPSPSINQTVLLNLAAVVNRELAKPEISGVVITHGTDTLEETAFFLELTVNSTKPVICVGAMRPATALSADGSLNLYQAVTLAASPNARGRGTMITLNDRIGSAFYTTKNHANALDTFYASEQGQLGFFINQVPYFYFPPASPIGLTHFNISAAKTLPQIDILFGHQDMNPALFNASVASGARGIVIAGTGSGGVSITATTAAEAVFNRTGVPIISSRRSAVGFATGSTTSWRIGSGFYNPQKTRILLQLAVYAGYDISKIRELFAKSYPDRTVLQM